MSIVSVTSAYMLYGMVLMNIPKPLMFMDSGTAYDTAAAQLEMGAIMHIGAAVASMM